MHHIAVNNWGEEETMDQLTALYRDVRYGGTSDEEPQHKAAKSFYKKISSI